MDLKDIKYKNIIISPRGKVIFRYNCNCENGYEVEVINYNELQYEMSEYSLIGDIMTGYEFYNCVDCGGIIDYDGCIGRVYFCGYETNLGLSHNGLHQGAFQVDGKTWKKLCDEYEILVEWCNK